MGLKPGGRRTHFGVMHFFLHEVGQLFVRFRRVNLRDVDDPPDHNGAGEVAYPCYPPESEHFQENPFFMLKERSR